MKKTILSFGIWMRNGISFCTTWLLLLVVAYSLLLGKETIPTITVIKLICFVIGGVFQFTLFFNKEVIRHIGFTARLTGFMFIFAVYEALGFYFVGLFQTKGSLVSWIMFVVIILVLYLVCLLIYSRYSRHQGQLYTSALHSYQAERLKQRNQ